MIIVDGSSMLHRTLHTGLIELKTSNGQYRTGGIHGFINSLGHAVKFFQQKHGVLVAWDLGGSAARRAIFPDYKKKQHDVDPTGKIVQPTAEEQTFTETLYFSRKWLHSEILPRLGCISVLIREVEGDDIISWVCRHGPRDEKRLIVSGDRDLLQLVDDDTDWYDPQREKYYDKESLIEEFKLDHNLYVEHFIVKKALTGDGDFPGLGARINKKGLGDVTASKLAHFIIHKNFEALNEAKFGLEVRSNHDILLQNIKLCNLFELGDEVDQTIREYVLKSIQLDMSDKEHELNAIFDQFELISAKGQIPVIAESNFNGGLFHKLEKYNWLPSELKDYRLSHHLSK